MSTFLRHCRQCCEAICDPRTATAARGNSCRSLMVRAGTVIAVVAFLFITAKANAAGGIYRPINYQGRITNSGGYAVHNGKYNMRFKIFNVPTGGTALWTETWNSSSQQVTLTGGLFSLALGTQTAMTGSVDFSTDSIYLQVEFDPDNDSSYPEVFTPRRRFGSVPFAHNADMLDGLDANRFLRSDTDTTASGTITIRPRDASKLGIDLISNAGIPSLAGLRISTQGANHIIFGSGATNYDTNLYRSAADTLKTDDAFHVAGTLSGARLVISGNAALSGSLVIVGPITARGAYSGSVIHAEKSLTSSGSLTWEGSASGASLWVSTFQGAGLVDCDLSTDVVRWDATTKRFSCGTVTGGSAPPEVGTASFSGATLVLGDARYVKKQGDTMTGSLVINVANGDLNTVGLKVINTLSGASIHAETSLTTSGSLVFEGSASGSSLWVSTFQGAGLVDCDLSTNVVRWDETTKRFSCGTVSAAPEVGTASFSGATLVLGDARYVNQSGDTMTGALLINVTGGDDNTIGLNVLNTLSGAKIHATKQMTTSGSLFVEKNVYATYFDASIQFLGQGSDTVTLPSYSWTGDTNTGMYRPAADTIGLVTAGVERVRIAPTGNVTFYNNVDARNSFAAANLNIGALTVGTYAAADASFVSVAGMSAFVNPGGALVFEDTFTEASNTPLDSHTPDTGTSWTALIINGATSMQVNGTTKSVEAPATVANVGSLYTADVTLPSADYEVSIDANIVTTSDDVAIIAARIQNADNMYLFKFSSTAANNILYKRVASTWTVLGTSTVGFVAGNRVRLRVVGSTINVYRDQQLILSVIDDSITGAGKAGLGIGNIAVAADDTSTVWDLDNFQVRMYGPTSKAGLFMDGNVGIDTLNPGSRLSVSGAVIIGNAIGAAAADTGVLLEIIGTASGLVLHAQDALSSSGSLVWESSASGASLWVSTFEGAGLVDCDLSTDVVRWDETTKRFSCGTVTGGSAPEVGTASFSGATLVLGDARYVKQQGGTMTGALVIDITGGNINTLGLKIINTLSGASIHAEKSLTTSGSLVFEGSASGSSLWVSTFNGAGLTNCDPTSGKLIWSNGRFVCGTDQAAGTGLDQNTADARYVRQQGGTMTGALVIDIRDGSLGTLGLKIINTLSGAVIHAEKSLTASGTLSIEQNNDSYGAMIDQNGDGIGLRIDSEATSASALYITHKGDHGYTNAALLINDEGGAGGVYITSTAAEMDAPLAYFDASGDEAVLKVQQNGVGPIVTVFDNTTQVFTILDGGNVGIGTTTPEGALEIVGTTSGSIIHAQSSLSSSGSLVWEGSASGASLWISTFEGAGLVDCDLSTDVVRWDATTKRFSCGTVTGGSATPEVGTASFSGATLVLGDARYVNQSGDTMTGALSINLTSGYMGLRVLQMMSGSVIHAEKSLTSSGTILAVGNISTRGTLSGRLLVVSGNASVSGALLTKGNITTRGTLSGRLLVISGNASVTGSLVVRGNIANRGTFSGNNLHVEKSLTSSGLIMVTQRTVRGSGALVINQLAAATGAYIRGTATTGGNSPLLVLDSPSGNASANPHILFGYQGTFDTNLYRSAANTLKTDDNLIVSRTLGVGVIAYGGSYNYMCYSSTGMLVVCGSSIRYKEDVQDLSLGLETLQKMRPVDFNWKGDGTPDIGLIAEELASVDERLVFERNGLIEGVRYQQITPILINAVKALDVRTLGMTNASGTVLHARDLLSSSGGLVINGFGTFGSGMLLNTAYRDGSANVLEIKTAVNGTGTTVFRVNASGSVFISGTFNAQGADYAEWFRESGQQDAARLQPGETVCLDTTTPNAVRRCERDGDNNIIGIVSTDPAFIGNVKRGVTPTGHVLVGLIGQVPAKAMVEVTDGEGGADVAGVIRPGDSLAAASVPGYVRKAKPGESTVGVALEPLAAGQGSIKVLISRRNQSLTVEAVEQKVTTSIASMNIQDQINVNMKERLAALDLSPTVRSELDRQILSIDIESLVDAAVQKRLSGAVLDSPSVTDELLEEISARIKIGTGSVTVDPTLMNAIADLRADMDALTETLTGSELRVETATVEDLTVRRSMTISGAVILSTGSTIRFGSGLTLGSLHLSGTGVTIGSLMASGALRVVGPITIDGLAMFLGDVRIAGQLVLSNRQAGFAVIPETGSSVTVRFDQPMIATPIVTATPDVPTLFGVGKVTATGFVIRIAAPATEKITFSFIALAADGPRTTMGTGTFLLAGGLIPFPVNAKYQPFSMTDPVWTACVQGRQTLDSIGIPFSCNRYHDGPVWEHPDLKVFFTWNPNHDPPIFTLPEGYQVVVVDDGLNDGQVVTQDDVPHAAAPETGSGSESGSGILLDPSTGSGETLPPETGSGDTVAPPEDDVSPVPDAPPVEDVTPEPAPSTEDPMVPDESPTEDPMVPDESPTEDPIVPDEPPTEDPIVPDISPAPEPASEPAVEAPAEEVPPSVVPLGDQLAAPAPDSAEVTGG